MSTLPDDKIAIVVPVYNEAAGLAAFHSSLCHVLAGLHEQFEVIYCDDGSRDDSLEQLQAIASKNRAVRVIRLSRNFGKESATTAGIHEAHGAAIITIDADGQHPVELIPELIKRWRAGSKVVIGLRTSNQQEGLVKRLGSKWFYRIINRLTGIALLPGATDYRLIDHTVQQQFARMTERNRITRGLIDWLGYQREYVAFTASPRLYGSATYSFKKLFKLAIDSFISLSVSPLYITAYIGAFVLPVSVLLGLFMIIEKLVGDPLNLHITGGGYVMILLLFLIGVLLMSQGIIGLYLSHIHNETQNRPLYVIDSTQSRRIHES